MEQLLTDHLRALANSHAAATGQSLATVAEAALGDWRFFDRIEEGRSYRVVTYTKAVRWFRRHWLACAPWPQPSVAEIQAALESSAPSLLVPTVDRAEVA